MAVLVKNLNLKGVPIKFKFMFIKILTAFTFLTFFTVISLVGFQTPTGLLIKDWIASMPYGDKTIHFLLLAGFAALLGASTKLRKVNILGHALLLSSLLLAVGITLEECSQIFIPSRNFEIMDMVCNYAGIYVGSLIPVLLSLKQTTDANQFRHETLSVQTIRHRAGSVHHEGGHGRRAARRMGRRHGS